MYKKILFIVSEDKYFISHRLNLAKFAQSKNIMPEVVCKATDKVKILKKENIKVYDWRLNRGYLNMIKEIKIIIDLYKIIKKSKADLIHAVAIKPVIYSGILNLIFFKKNIIFALGGLGFIYSSKKILAKIIKLIVNTIFSFIFKTKNSFILLQNKDDKNLLLSEVNINQNIIKIIPGSGVNTDIYKPLNKKKNDNDNLNIMFAGRILWDKGILEFINLARTISNYSRKIKFLVVGEVDTHNPEYVSNKYVDQWKKENNVEFLGYSKNMVETLSDADIFCFPSYREGFPKVLLEASSMQIPLVAFNVPGSRDAIIDKKTGFLIPFKDENLLKLAILKLIKSKHLRKTFGSNGRKFVVENFSEEIISDMTFSLWEKLLKY